MKFKATLYGKSIQANTMQDLKRKASMIANPLFNVIDEMTVEYDGGMANMRRINRKTPWNTITYDRWH